MSETAELLSRIEKLEENFEALRARHGVTRRVLHGVLGAIEAGAQDTTGRIRTAIQEKLRPQIEQSSLSPRAKRAALDALASFGPISHQSDPESLPE